MCLLALTSLLHAALPSSARCHEIQKAADKICQIANKTHPHSFHVPVDVQEECLDTAITCFRSQIPKLHIATGKSKAAIKEFGSCIRKIKLSNPHDREGCTPCSKYAKQSPEEFLNKMKLLLQENLKEKVQHNLESRFINIYLSEASLLLLIENSCIPKVFLFQMVLFH
ncbi:interleukin-21 [Eleutherodactylus coqui]|uniref:interleukin-21 n=1 Tax=Eleutherodactylus coqui TaxID=57060 RepID=UPI0034634DF4